MFRRTLRLAAGMLATVGTRAAFAQDATEKWKADVRHGIAAVIQVDGDWALGGGVSLTRLLDKVRAAQRPFEHYVGVVFFEKHLSRNDLRQLSRLRLLVDLSLIRCDIERNSIASLTSLPSLRRLILAGTHLTRDDLEKIAQIPSLQELDVSHSGIAPSLLVSLRKSSSLRVINVAGLGLEKDVDVVRQVQDALPHVVFHFTETKSTLSIGKKTPLPKDKKKPTSEPKRSAGGEQKPEE